MTYKITMSGSDLHHYGNGAYGWGKFSTITGHPGALVLFFLRSEAEDWIEHRAVFCSGARVVLSTDRRT
jgi:hypothetical protein